MLDIVLWAWTRETTCRRARARRMLDTALRTRIFMRDEPDDRMLDIALDAWTRENMC